MESALHWDTPSSWRKCRGCAGDEPSARTDAVQGIAVTLFPLDHRLLPMKRREWMLVGLSDGATQMILQLSIHVLVTHSRATALAPSSLVHTAELPCDTRIAVYGSAREAHTDVDSKYSARHIQEGPSVAEPRAGHKPGP